MKRVFKSIISFVLIACMLFAGSISAFAAKAEEYICELRLVYADDYDEAKAILADSAFNDYKIYNSNLNKDTGEVGVWLAYKTTTDIEDAITDLAVMQMEGGYKEGNYQAMISASYAEYIAMGTIYLDAIRYFKTAYLNNNSHAKMAYRQLNFYIGLDDREGEKLGDIFVGDIEEEELATMFFQGNSYVLQNVRSLLAMGVSYNEDGKTYFQKVGDAAAEMNADPNVYVNKGYETIADMIAPTIKVFQEMFQELELYEKDLNYTDDNVTDDEIRYAEYKAFAEHMRKVNYLGGKTLYDFCVNYKEGDDTSDLYPLVAALNKGQIALTKVAHYYDVVRYGMTVYDEEYMDGKISELEAIYVAKPFNVYAGVDREVYKGTFALTTEAYRADAYTESGISEALFGEGSKTNTMLSIYGLVGGAGMFALGFLQDMGDYYDKAIEAARNIDAAVKAKNLADMSTITEAKTLFAYKLVGAEKVTACSIDDILTNFITSNSPEYAAESVAAWPLADKYQYYSSLRAEILSSDAANENVLKIIDKQLGDIVEKNTALAKSEYSTNFTFASSAFSAIMYVVGGTLMLYSAYNIIADIVNYYNPDYTDVPLSMVDLIETVDGDRYIKYDVVYEAEARGDDGYSAGDLNAYEAERWNALYYTKSYEAGHPLLANAFTVSNTNNRAKSGYTAVHRFGERVCYDLNKYNFDDDVEIYLSVKQSKNKKSAVADVPEVVGSMFGTGFLVLAGGIGAIAGIGGTLATYEIVKKKKAQEQAEE